MPTKPVPAPLAAVESAEGPAEKDLPKALDLPLYPGAKVVKNKIALAGAEKRYHVTLSTKDTPQQVAAFYQAHGLPFAAKGDKAQALGQTKHGNMVIIDVDRKGDLTEIAIKDTAAGHG